MKSSRPHHRGVTLLELLVVIAITAVLVGLFLSAVQRVRAAAGRSACSNNLRQLGIGLQAYHDANGRYPLGCSPEDGTNPYPYMSWCCSVLPYLEQGALWEQAKASYGLDRDFLSAAHAGYRGQVLKVFACPADARTSQPGKPTKNGLFEVGFTSYLGVEGTDYLKKDGILFLASQIRTTDITDGLSNTLLVGERPPSPDQQFGWWYAGTGQADSGSCDMVLGVQERNVWWSARQCWSGPYFFGPGSIDNPCDMFHFWSPHPGGANFAFADGSVRFLRYSADPIMPALATRAGGEVVSVPD